MELLKIIRKLLYKYDNISVQDNSESDNFEYEKKFKVSYLKKTFPFIKPYIRLGLLASILMLFSALLSIPQPLLTKYIIDDVVIKKDISILSIIVIFVILILILDGIVWFLKQFYFNQFEQFVIFEIQQQLINRVLRFPKSFFDSKQTGYLMSRLSKDVFELRMIFSSTVVELITNLFKFIGAIVVLFIIHWKLALLSLFVIPFFYSTVRSFSEKTRKVSHRMMEKTAYVSNNLQETISGIGLIKVFAAEHKEATKISLKLKDLISLNIEKNTICSFSEVVMGLFASMGTVLILWYGSKEIMFNRLTVGEFIAFNSYLGYLYTPSRFLATMNVFLQSSFAALERVFMLFELIPEDEDDENKIKVRKLNGAITFENITFYYDYKRPVLKNISFQVNPGEKIAIVGPTGAGKSTLINLIIRLYNAKFGKILFDDKESSQLNLSSIRERISLVSQEIFLFDDTIINNIRYGNSLATDKEVYKVAELAYAHQFITQLQEGYQTRVGERGVKLSTGQKQRISIARAILKNPDILIFDEPTSALDALTEKAIKEMLFEKTNGKTTFVIAHRLSTVTTADKILVLNEGHIVQRGTHHDLIQQEGLYRKMCEEQLLV